jgi:glucan 1,3-beta-glucosidase
MMRRFRSLAFMASLALSQVASAAPWSRTGSQDVPSTQQFHDLSVASSNSDLGLAGPLESDLVPRNAKPKDIMRGVNIGSWLILEFWMTPHVFAGTNTGDQISFDATPGAQSKLKKHWDTYFTEADVEKLASWGINALRIPIGFWAYDNANTPYLSGADAYLEKAVGWARKHNMKVIVDCHGSPGSQNGFDSSGRSGIVDWQNPWNLERSIQVLEKIARKYGSKKYADVVYGIELVNEPISWGGNDFLITKLWAQAAYFRVQAAADNDNLAIIMHDGFMRPENWVDVGLNITRHLFHQKAPMNFILDTHLYQNQMDDDSKLSEKAHIQKACGWRQSEPLNENQNGMPVIVGEFSAQMNVCAYPDGTITPGTVCNKKGCQCSSNVDVQYWSQPLIDAHRRFVEAQLDTFESSTHGWFMWAYKGPGAWGLDNAVKYGLIGKKVTDRKFPNQCKGS